MKAKKLLIAALFASVAAVAVGAFSIAQTSEIIQSKATIGYTCGSIKFGMKDSDSTAVVWDVGTGTTDLSGYYTATNNLIQSIECETYVSSGKTKNLVFGAGNYSGPAGYSKYVIRVGASKKKGSFTITFSENIVGCTVYALSYKNKDNNVVDKTTMLVNSQEALLQNSALASLKADAAAVTFDAYSFTFAATNTLTIGSKQDTVDSISASRFFVANIAVRVAS